MDNPTRAEVVHLRWRRMLNKLLPSWMKEGRCPALAATSAAQKPKEEKKEPTVNNNPWNYFQHQMKGKGYT